MALHSFKKHVSKSIAFVKSFKDERITPKTMKLYHRRKPANEALEDYIDDTIASLTRKRVRFTISVSKDQQKVRDSLAGMQQTHNEKIVMMLSHKVREPRRLVFFPGAVFEATENTNNYAQSQLMIIIDPPSNKTIQAKKPFEVMAAPAGGARLDEILSSDDIPTEDYLCSKGWKKVVVNISDERIVPHRGITACRRQYTLKHIGNSTVCNSVANLPKLSCLSLMTLLLCCQVHKQMGQTLQFPSAIEVSK